jgi:hypothetical protein
LINLSLRKYSRVRREVRQGFNSAQMHTPREPAATTPPDTSRPPNWAYKRKPGNNANELGLGMGLWVLFALKQGNFLLWQSGSSQMEGRSGEAQKAVLFRACDGADGH